MSTVVDVRTEQRPTRAGDESADHLFCCCSPTIALCGADIAGEPECLDCDHPECEACAAVCDVPCILCGFTTEGPCYCGGC